eukprot:Lankesteria_metandrocarpae@DN1617_c0_g1_i2.p1
MYYVIYFASVVLVANAELYKGYNFKFLPDFNYGEDVKSSVRTHLYEKHMELRVLLRESRSRRLHRENNAWCEGALTETLQSLYVSINLSHSDPAEMKIYKFEFSFYEGPAEVECKQIQSITIPVWFEEEDVGRCSSDAQVLISGLYTRKGKVATGWNYLSELKPESHNNSLPSRIRIWIREEYNTTTYLYHEYLDVASEIDQPLFLMTNLAESYFDNDATLDMTHSRSRRSRTAITTKPAVTRKALWECGNERRSVRSRLAGDDQWPSKSSAAEV